MAFIRRSGINPLLPSLRRHCQRGKPLRILTTIYTGSTERSALQQLNDIGGQVRISYDVSTTRLHAKSWIFHRHSGFSTAYVGSSSLTHSAQVTGLGGTFEHQPHETATSSTSSRRSSKVIGRAMTSVPFDAGEFDAEFRRTGCVDTGPTVILSPHRAPVGAFPERLLERSPCRAAAVTTAICWWRPPEPERP